ncbi:bifunctional 2-polyprenyl-6-hydroxyphenol methylase/3-demethylubiquinol 3-O-methyltransferase UbiG [Demequina sp. NBRC 110051]|uniref:class I SAM-dependent methyltransferase n=1 Tax=Demequina sp. NBRC 110051 TaxID=1570340 RepID=UPI0009FF186F|nr:class I SAM-dependent methyltransferase [Demequina sp. NBRC 110051]
MSELGADATVSWEEARSVNLANWEARVPLHVDAYPEVAALRADPAAMSAVVAHDLEALGRSLPAGIAGLDVCHLQCHIGTDTLSLARAGARVTGVDFSPSALAAARALAAELGLAATWVETDVLDARAAVVGDFDLVYTSIGAITWLRDLDRWAAQVAALLRPGGVFYLRDGHPALYSLDETADGLVTRYRYFANGDAIEWNDESTYAGDGTVTSPRTLEYPHALSETVTALLSSGLALEAFDEGTTLPWKFSDLMEGLPGGDYAYPEPLRSRIPTTFTLVARKPA